MSTIIKPFRMRQLEKYTSTSSPKILDIGCGSHSSTIAKKWIPNCHYTGVDQDRYYRNTEEDLNNMDAFIEMDLTQLQFDSIADDTYDMIIMSHVIEHLYNGDEVLALLWQKLKPGGLFYVEFPCEASVAFPSKRDTLNFFDDDTHVRIYTIKEVANIVLDAGGKVLSAGKSRLWVNILLMLIKVPLQLITKGYVSGGVYWDYYGFADYVIARR